MRLPSFLLLLCLWGTQLNSVHANDAVTLTNKEGVSIQAILLEYSPKDHIVEIRLTANNKRMKVKEDLFDDNSIQTIKDWYQLIAATRRIDIRAERVSNKDGGRYYEIEFGSMAEAPVNQLRVEYQIPIKSIDVEIIKTSSGKGKKKRTNTKEIKHESTSVTSGSIDVGTIEPRGRATFSTKVIPKKGPKGLNYPKGAYLKVYMGDQLIREIETEPSVQQWVSKYK
jgi:hypothetical protein